MTWEVRLTPLARQQLQAMNDTRVRSGIQKVIGRLTHDPEKQGKSLSGVLAGYRSIRAVGQRYRIIYEIQASEIIVVIVTVGIRREGSRSDVYMQAERDVISGKIDTIPE